MPSTGEHMTDFKFDVSLLPGCFGGTTRVTNSSVSVRGISVSFLVPECLKVFSYGPLFCIRYIIGMYWDPD